MPIRAVIFDLGGVVFESPVEFIVSFERDSGLPPGFVGGLLGQYAGEDGMWQQLERGEVSLADFCERMDRRISETGHTMSTEAMMRGMSQNARIRARMLDAIRRLRGGGYSVVALTNNWITDDAQDRRTDELRKEFDLFIESCKVGMRKPEERIYHHTLHVLGCAPDEVAFLDDIGGNLKVARRLGIQTIKVADPDAALDDLARLVTVSLE